MAMEQHLYRGGSEADFESPDWWSTEIDGGHSDSDHRDTDSDSGDEWGLGDYNDEDDGWDIVKFPISCGLDVLCTDSALARMSTVIAM